MNNTKELISTISNLNKNNLELLYESIQDNKDVIASKLDFKTFRCDNDNKYECKTFGCILGQATEFLPKEFVDKHIEYNGFFIDFISFGNNIIGISKYVTKASILFAYLFGSSWSITKEPKLEQVERFCERIDLLITAIDSKKYINIIEQINKFEEFEKHSLINGNSKDIIKEVMIK